MTHPFQKLKTKGRGTPTRKDKVKIVSASLGCPTRLIWLIWAILLNVLLARGLDLIVVVARVRTAIRIDSARFVFGKIGENWGQTERFRLLRKYSPRLEVRTTF